MEHADTSKTTAPAPVAAARGLLAVGVAAYAALSLTGAGRSWFPPAAEHWMAAMLLGTGGVLCLLRGILRRGQRVAWLVIGAGLISWAEGEILFAAVPGLASGPLSLANLLSLAFYPAAAVAMMALLRARLETFFTTLWLDGLAGALSVCALVASFVFPPVLANATGNTLTVIGDVSYPLADLLLVAAALFAVAMTGWRPGRTLGFVIVALSLVAVTDSFSLYWAATGHAAAETQLQWLRTAAALIIVEMARRPGKPATATAATSLSLLVFPVAVSLTALGLLLSGLVRSLELAGYELAVAALILIVVRLALTGLENLQMAASSKREALTA